MKTVYSHTSRTRRFDVVLALGLMLLTWAQLLVVTAASRTMVQISTQGFDIVTGFHQRPFVGSFLLATLCFLPLIWRRNHPLIILAIVTIAQCMTSLYTHDPLLTFVAPLIALYTVGTLVSTRRLVIAAVLVATALVGVNHFAPMMRPNVAVQQKGVDIYSGKGNQGLDSFNDGVYTEAEREQEARKQGNSAFGFVPDLPEGFALKFVDLARGRSFVGVLQIVASVVAFAALGRMTRLHREFIESARMSAAEAERAREETALRRAEEERLRIARELHDITAHSLMAVVVQAGAAEALITTDPAEATRTVQQIRDVAKKSLTELRSIVGVLREGGNGEDAPLVPEVSLKDLDDLVKSFENSGLSVEVVLREQANKRDALADVPAPISVAAYRIVQESLTNVLRHAQGATHAEVVLELKAHQLCVEVSDDGQTPPKEEAIALPCIETGHGIAGMRERAQALGGNFEAERSQGGKFVVKAALPL